MKAQRTAEALLERLDLLERRQLLNVADRFLVPGTLVGESAGDLAANVAGFIVEKGQVLDAHRYLDETEATS